jgi:hypothetical protein
MSKALSKKVAAHLRAAIQAHATPPAADLYKCIRQDSSTCIEQLPLRPSYFKENIPFTPGSYVCFASSVVYTYLRNAHPGMYTDEQDASLGRAVVNCIEHVGKRQTSSGSSTRSRRLYVKVPNDISIWDDSSDGTIRQHLLRIADDTGIDQVSACVSLHC